MFNAELSRVWPCLKLTHASTYTFLVVPSSDSLNCIINFRTLFYAWRYNNEKHEKKCSCVKTVTLRERNRWLKSYFSNVAITMVFWVKLRSLCLVLTLLQFSVYFISTLFCLFNCANGNVTLFRTLLGKNSKLTHGFQFKCCNNSVSCMSCWL